MADQGELAFVKAHLNALASLPVVYNNEFQQPPHDTLKKVPVLGLELPPPPKRIEAEPSSSAAHASISIAFKSLKPPKVFSLSVSPADTISDIKSQLAAQDRAPPADAQRLLLKGKALADTKLLREYGVKEGDTINLMIKPGFEWDPRKTPSPASAPIPPTSLSPPTVDVVTARAGAETSTTSSRRGHGRVPSLVLSPSPDTTRPASPGNSPQPQDLDLLDDDHMPSPQDKSHTSAYHDTISQPGFWERLHLFFRSEFSTREDAGTAFEDFLLASKSTLTVSEIAKIRDHVGIVGMAGT